MFFDKICNIKSITTSYNTDGESIETESIIYSSIPCDFYKDERNRFKKDGFAVEGKHSDYTVVLEGDKLYVRIGQIIELIDSSIGTYGFFIIDDILVFRSIYGVVDNYQLKVSQKKK